MSVDAALPVLADGDSTRLRCAECGREFGLGPLWAGCPGCGGALFVTVPAEWFRQQVRAGVRGAQSTAFPEVAARPRFDEGATPLRPAPGLAAAARVRSVWVKDETRNPTGTFKDRLNATASATMSLLGIDRLVTSSTGNQAVSAVWYARRRGIEARAFLPDDVPGTAAEIVRLYDGDARVVPWGDRAALMREHVEAGWGYVGRNAPRPLANPYGLEGYKSIAVEIVDDLHGRVPDLVVMPACGGDGFAGLARGFLALLETGLIARLPRLVAVQPAASASLVAAWDAGADRVEAIGLGWSIAHSLRDAQTGDHALRALRATDGLAVSVDEDELRTGIVRLGAAGVFAEPAGAAAAAGLLRAADRIDDAQRARLDVVVVATGSGDRWPVPSAGSPPRNVDGEGREQ